MQYINAKTEYDEVIRNLYFNTYSLIYYDTIYGKDFFSSDDQARRTFQLPDLRQVTVLSKADWQRIQRELDPDDREQESVIEEAKQRKVLHLQSVEVVKQWSNTIAVS